MPCRLKMLALPVLALMLATSSGNSSETSSTSPEDAKYRQWVEAMKQAERGPFSRLRWYCQDGSVLPPEAYACADHGGGHQHGEWSEHTRTLREQGFYIATLLAGADGDEWLAQEQVRQHYAHLVIERFLVGVDDGWILRRALFYRGAIQEEDEREGARELLTAMLDDEWWRGPGFVALRTGASLLPHGQDSASIDRVRSLSANLNDRDSSFQRLRARIHGSPSAGDAQRVRDYAQTADAALQAQYEALAQAIDAAYGGKTPDQRIDDLLDQDPPDALAVPLRQARDAWRASNEDASRLAVTATLMRQMRDVILELGQSKWRLAAVDLSLAAETQFFIAATRLNEQLDGLTRQQLVALLQSSFDAAYGAGLINPRLDAEASKHLRALSQDQLPLEAYRRHLDYLGRSPGWASQALRMHFFESMQTLSRIEPLAMHFIPDQLRGGPMLAQAALLDRLSHDAGQLAGVRHQLFGETIGAGFTALNPGLSRGTLHPAPDMALIDEFQPGGIYVLPETVSDLPPVAGILTAGEGNPLSHVQLLARNLGIPNATIDQRLQDRLQAHAGAAVVYAVSPGGLVEISEDGPRWQDVFGDASEQQSVTIRPDLDKLDLDQHDLIPLDKLRADDSGRTVGPKAAKLGELRQHFPAAVANGVAIPFGMFNDIALGQAHPDGGTVRDWMVASYRALGPIDDQDEQQAARYEAFRAELYQLILDTPLDQAFRDKLRAALLDTFGEQPPGLFIRSDTNVEDLAGFTGAGLNLTLPNVVGEDALLDGIRKVWASPFTARAFAWRQSHMSAPEHVYTSILLLQSVGSDKSGVLVTADIDSGDRGWLSVAVNEGLGGAVDGQAAESLRIDTSNGQVRVLATATAPWRRVPDPQGGLEFLPASGSDVVLQPDEIRQLIQFHEDLPERFPPIVDDDGQPAPADVEFGFVDGRMQLFQLRPFLGNKATSGNRYLAEMDQRMGGQAVVTVNMKEQPAND